MDNDKLVAVSRVSLVLFIIAMVAVCTTGGWMPGVVMASYAVITSITTNLIMRGP